MIATIIRRHADRYRTTDSCHIHGIGLSVCRVCVGHDPERPIKGKHRNNDVDVLVGFHRV